MPKYSHARAKVTIHHDGGYAPIAIIGMAFRFPGDIHDESGMWDMLEHGRNCITQVPDVRWPVSELQHPNRTEPGRSVSFAAGVLSGIDQFDAAFFGISPREAAWLDPQQRLLLEMAHEALEDAGVRPSSLAGTRCGVYVGISSLDYGVRGTEDLASMSAYSMTGNTLSIAVNRLSYIYDLHGPSLAVDTACSSSLVALHYACQALHTGDVPMALAGGVSLLMHPYSFVGFSKASMLSACGHCRPFDAAGDGYVRSEGGALLLLKPLHKAVEDGDHIHAVIVGSGVNTDGKRKAGLTIPSGDAQAELMRGVLRQSGLDAEQVDFIEAHGTGTPVGDPVEVSAIGQVYGQGRKSPIPISSVKANVGHLEPASGMAGLVKAVLSLKKGILPPMLLDYTPNPHIDFSGHNVLCAASGMSLPERSGHDFTAGVNSFGFGGVNAHMLLRAFDGKGKPLCQTTAPCTVLPPLLLSARSEGALRDLAAAYAARIAEADSETYYNIAYCTAIYRDRQEKRLAILAESPAAIATELHAFAEALPSSHLHVESVTTDSDAIAFVYTGNGAQWEGMGRILLEESSEFAAIMAKLDAQMHPVMGFSVVRLLRNAEHGALQDTTVSQPLLFAIQVGLTQLLRTLGLTPHAVMGHSVGEITAAWAAGALSLTQAIQVIHARSHAQGLTRGMGRMAVVGLSAAAAQEYINEMRLSDTVEIAGINSAHNVTLSGDLSSLARLQEFLQAQDIFCRALDLDYAFHSCKMDGIHDTLMQGLAGLAPAESTNAVFVSTVTGQVLAGTALNDEYWWRNVRQPVLFSHAVEELTRLGFRIFVEVGPHAILQRYIREGLAAAGCKGRVLSSLLRGDDGQSRITKLALRLHTITDKTDSSVFFPHKGAHVSLPLYPWQREKYWYPRTTEYLPEKRRTHPLLGWPLEGVELVWENILDPVKDVWLTHHRVGDATVFPAAGYAELALAMARNWLNEDSSVLEALDIGIPLVFEDGGAQALRCSLNGADGSFRILSRPRLGTGDWVQHASGRILSAAGRLPAPCMEPIAAHCQAMDGPQLYALTSALGLDYGPTFQVVRGMALAEDRLDVTLNPVDSGQQGYLLHPAVLDACFHALVGLYAGQAEIPQTAFLPVKTGRISLCKVGIVTHIRGHLRSKGRRSIVADFELLDAAGCLVASATACRFRAMPLAQSKREGVSAWSILPWLCPRPYASSEAVVLHLDEIVKQLNNCASGNGQRRELWFRQALPLMEATTLSFVLRAFHALAADNPDWYQHLSAPYARWLSGLLQREGLLTEQAGQWRLAPLSELPPAEELWQETLRQAPECLPSLLPVGRVGLCLEDILRGRTVGTTLLDDVCHAPVVGDSQPCDPAYTGIDMALRAVLRNLAPQWPPHKRLRVLEIASFHSGLTEVMGEYLPADRFEHVMALSESKALGQARTLYEQYAHVRTVSFDALLWAVEDKADLGRFDVVIVRHALHRAVNLGDALARVRTLMVDGGLLLLAERHPDWSVDVLEGLKPAWWHEDATDPHLPQSSLLSPASWQHILEEQGFAPCRVYHEPAAEGLAEGAYLLLATHSGQENLTPAAPEPASWLLLADKTTDSQAQALRAHLEAHGQKVLCAVSEDVKPLPCVEHVVFMRGADDAPHEAAHTLHSLLRCARECAEREVVPRLWIVTRGGALSTHVPAGCLSQPAQCALWGLGRVIANEYANVQCTLVDMAQYPAMSDAASPQLLTRLAEELLHPDGNDEILLTTTARYALRVAGDGAGGTLPVQSSSHVTRCRLDFAVPGSLRNLIWYAEKEPSLAQDEIEARVMGVGLNFRDVMLTMGLLPDDALENGFAGPSLGLEFSGVITRVGAGVTDLQVGDRVVGFAPACFASHVVTSARTVARIPEDWSFASAATIPTVFFTAYYALKHLAQVQAGERVLIHGGAGGVGLAAIQVARHLGADIFVTAGSEEKRDFLRLLGVKHIFDSRSLSFDHDIRCATDGQGVDVVLNSLAGEAMRRSLSLLKPFGRFLELGKRDFVENTSLGLRPLKENISYFAIDADQLLVARPPLAADLFQEVMQLLREGIFTLLPHRLFPAKQVVEAFRAMQQSRHMGKIVVSLEDVPEVQGASTPAHGPAQEGQRNCQNPKRWLADEHSTWLITGGLGGFGLATARHLAQRGVKHLVLVGRGSAQSPSTDLIIAEFAALGVKAHAKVCDIADSAAVHALVDQVCESLPPLKGIIHAAAVFDDRMLDNLDLQSLEAVLAPKLSGAWHLHEATLDVPLEHFVLYSSISTVLGNPGQGNYVAANAGLEGLAQKRMAMGLPATCLAWGPVGDVGYLARHDAVKKSLSFRLGREALTAAEALEQLDTVLAVGGAGIFAHVEWNAVMGMFPDGGPARFEHVFGHGEQGGRSDAVQDLQQLLSEKSIKEITGIIHQLIVEEVAQVLALGVEQVPSDRSLQAMGMDSLMAVELAVSLEKRMGVRLPAMMLQDSPTVEQVTARILTRLSGSGDGQRRSAEKGNTKSLREEDEQALTAAELVRRHAEEHTEGGVTAMTDAMRDIDTLGKRA